jgi:hypothetical protein
MKTTVVNIRDGFPTGGVYIGRAGRGFDGYFGNPVPIQRSKDRDEVIVLFRQAFERRMMFDAEYRYRIEELKGRTLVCFCKPLACHGDVIAEYLNR